MTEVRSLCFSYGKRRILNNLTFSVEPGECVVLAGPNGSGKSTALSVLAGVLRPDSGSVALGGSMGYVPQGTALFEDMSVEDNLRFFAGLAKCTVPDRLPFGVETYRKRRVSALSGGMKKQVSIACALLGDPQVLLLDEPCASLDVEYREELIAIIRKLKEEGRAIVYVSHEPMEFESFYDKLIFMSEGYPCYTKSRLSGDPADVGQLCRSFSELFRKAN